jgi:transcriptional regulator with XRE-family HTH domain
VQGEGRRKRKAPKAKRQTRATPKQRLRAGRGQEAAPGATYQAEALAENVRAWRLVRDLTQEELAAGMKARGHEWSAGTVGFVERGDRTVSVDEYVSLAIALDVGTPGALLDVRGIDGRRRVSLDYGVGFTLPPAIAGPWLRGQIECRFDGGSLVDIEPVSGFDDAYTDARAAFDAGEHVRVIEQTLPPKRDPSTTQRVQQKRQAQQKGEWE